VKRLIVLLIVLAGALAAAAFAVPSNAATVNGVSITQQALNSDLSAIANSPDYQCFLNAEEAVGSDGQTALPPVAGAGRAEGSGTHPTITAGFVDNYLSTAIGHQLILQLADRRHVHLTANDVTAAHTALIDQISGILQEVAGSKYACGAPTAKAILATMPSSFVNESVRFGATVSAYEEDVADVGSSTADLKRYFDAHAAEFDTACFTVAEYSSQSAAAAAVAQVAAGTPFAQVAAAASGGGPQGCDILYQVAADLPAGSDLQSQAVNAVSSPIAEDGDYLVVQITSKSPTSFAKARTEVESAVTAAGATKAQTLIDKAEKSAKVSVDGRYGQWKTAQAEILPPTSPLAVDVLNPSVNSVGTATATTTTTTPTTGQSS